MDTKSSLFPHCDIDLCPQNQHLGEIATGGQGKQKARRLETDTICNPHKALRQVSWQVQGSLVTCGQVFKVKQWIFYSKGRKHISMKMIMVHFKVVEGTYAYLNNGHARKMPC